MSPRDSPPKLPRETTFKNPPHDRKNNSSISRADVRFAHIRSATAGLNIWLQNLVVSSLSLYSGYVLVCSLRSRNAPVGWLALERLAGAGYVRFAHIRSATSWLAAGYKTCLFRLYHCIVAMSWYAHRGWLVPDMFASLTFGPLNLGWWLVKIFFSTSFYWIVAVFV